MRELTEEELKLAPEFCDKYFINTSNCAIYVNSKDMMVYAPWAKSPIRLGDAYYGYSIMKSINQFDITRHEFYDCEVKLDSICDKLICFNVSNNYPEFNRQDVIAMFKALGLTAEDLK